MVFVRQVRRLLHAAARLPLPVYFSETTLVDVAKDAIVWTGTIRTIDPENIASAIENYVATVIDSLKEKNLLRAGELERRFVSPIKEPFRQAQGERSRRKRSC